MHGKELVPLKRWSESDLVHAARLGNRTAIEYLLLEHMPLQRIVKSLARSLDPRSLAGDELIAAARLGIVEALRRFDPGQGVGFRTYAYYFIRGEMIRALYSQGLQREWNRGRPLPKLVPLSAESDGEGAEKTFEAELLARDSSVGTDPGYSKVDKALSEEAIRGFVAALPTNQREIVRDVFWNEMSHAEAARSRGVSRPAISQALQRAFKRGRRDLADHRECLAA